MPQTRTARMASLAAITVLTAGAGATRVPIREPLVCGLPSVGARGGQPLPSGIGEVSGLAASSLYPGWGWMVRDSGNPASLYALRLQEGAVPIVREVKVVGAHNRDWEDVVYARTGGASWLYVVDSGQSGRDRHIYQVPEPDPRGPQRVSWFRRYRYAYPRNTHYNTEAALFHAGRLFLVTKTTPGRLYRFDQPLSAERLNRPRFVGTLPGSVNVSVARVSPDGRFLITANHQRVFVYQAQPGIGPLARFTSRFPVGQTRVSPGDNVEAGDFFPANSCDLVLIAESRNVYRLSPRRPRVIAAEPPGSGRAGSRSGP